MESVKKFERENRYIVIKRSDLKKVPVTYRSTMITPMFNLLPHLPRRECVVVESDWPEYEIVWAMIEHRMGGKPVPDFDRIKAENQALQLLLNDRDDLDDQLTSLEQRRYAEQQAREAAERRVEALCAFANEMVDAVFEGGSLDGADIQDIAVKHGVLRIETREDECGERCACREYGFPAECYRRTELIALNPIKQ
ncbi:hypothetical protein [Pseudomonas sp. RL_105y_Pfl2_101]|uniref:hypothetical protein n=1 Tax=Pseudomonas sp. RL_105y_Pfl2_101 TaxID=3088708 RepID=UPI0030D7A07D